MKCLMLGAGHAEPERKGWLSETTETIEWTTLDINTDTTPDVVYDLNKIEYEDNDDGSIYLIPFDDESFSEIHAYEILEHYGSIGNYEGFFRGFRELWRILKLGGLLIGSTPLATALFSDPGHTRCVSFSMLSYLTKEYYENLGNPKCRVTDYRRFIDPCWWEWVDATPKNNTLGFALRKA